MQLMADGHKAIAQFLINRPYYLAWGRIPVGDPVWTVNPPLIDTLLHGLEDEVGRRVASVQQYVEQDPLGTIEVESVKWSISPVPTNHIYLKFDFAATDNQTDTLYSIGLFIGTIPMPAVGDFSSSINEVAGYPIGATVLTLGTINTGAIEDLLPNNTIGINGGRVISVGSNTVRIKSINSPLNQITVDPLTVAVSNGDPVSAAASAGTTMGQEYLTYEEVLDPGIIFLAENRPPMFRSFSTRESFEIILNI